MAGNKVTSIRSDIVETLEGLLERAKSGEIDTIAYAISRGAEYSGNGWVKAENAHVMVMVGELRCLERDFIDRNIELRIDPKTGEEYT